MQPYTCRRAQAADMNSVANFCLQTQDTYYDAVGKARIVWDQTLRNKVLNQFHTTVALASPTSKKIVGVMIMQFFPPRVVIHGISTDKALTDRERIGIGRSLLYQGYQACNDAGITWGEGECITNNTLIRETFEGVGLCKIEERGWTPATSITPVSKPLIWHIEIGRIDEAYRTALLKSIEAL